MLKDMLNDLVWFFAKTYRKFKETFLTKSFLEFCILGLINCFNDSLFSWIAYFFMQKNLAAVVGYMVSLTIAFLLTTRYIFKSKISFEKYVKFLISYIPNFIIFFLVTFITINLWKLPQFVGTFLAAMAGGPITFVIIKIYAFGKRQE